MPEHAATAPPKRSRHGPHTLDERPEPLTRKSVRVAVRKNVLLLRISRRAARSGVLQIAVEPDDRLRRRAEPAVPCCPGHDVGRRLRASPTCASLKGPTSSVHAQPARHRALQHARSRSPSMVSISGAASSAPPAVSKDISAADAGFSARSRAWGRRAAAAIQCAGDRSGAAPTAGAPPMWTCFAGELIGEPMLEVVAAVRASNAFAAALELNRPRRRDQRRITLRQGRARRRRSAAGRVANASINAFDVVRIAHPDRSSTAVSDSLRARSSQRLIDSGSPPSAFMSSPSAPRCRRRGGRNDASAIRFAPTGWPTARARYERRAISPYVRDSASGMARIASRTRHWNGVPCGASGDTVNRNAGVVEIALDLAHGAFGQRIARCKHTSRRSGQTATGAVHWRRRSSATRAPQTAL